MNSPDEGSCDADGLKVVVITEYSYIRIHNIIL